MDARPQRSDRTTLGRRFCRRNEGPGKRARGIGAQRYRRRFDPRDCGGHARDAHNTHHFCSKFRSGRLRLSEKPRSPRRQHHGLHQLRSGHREQVARTSKGGRASGGPRCDHIQPANGTLCRLVFAFVETAGPVLAIQPIAIPIRDAGTIEKAIEAFAREINSSLLVLPDVTTTLHEKLIVELAVQHRLPAIYPWRHFVTAGGLMCYAADLPNLWRRSASYVDRVLKGEKPADLPVQQPTKFEFVINLTAAKAVGLAIPASILSLADDLTE